MIALDSNILVHAHRRDASLHLEAQACVRTLAEGSSPWFICFHSLVEFYGVATHPRIWHQPSTPGEVAAQIEAWRESPTLRLLTDLPEHLAPLMTLAGTAKVAGAMIHDARIANYCLSYGVRELWTVDRDFSRFPALPTRNPLV